MKYLFRVLTFLVLIVLVCLCPLSRVSAQVDKDKAKGTAKEKTTIKLLSKNRRITMAAEGEKKYLSITKQSPVVILVQGPSILKVGLRKIIYSQRPDTLKPFKLSVILDGKEKRYQIKPAESTAYPGGKTYQTSKENILRLSIPEGEHRCEFRLPPTVIGGGAITFWYEKAPSEKVAKKVE